MSVNTLLANACLVLFAFSVTGCATPKDGAIFYSKPMPYLPRYCDKTSEYDAKYIRGTSDPDRILQSGGHAEHEHSYAHVHVGDTRVADPAFSPIGLSTKAASGTHTHHFETIFQEPTLTAAAPNDPPHLNVGMLISRGLTMRVPEGAIVAFVGTELPEGWLLCDGTNNTPDLRNSFLRISARGLGESGGSSTHVHEISHTHRVDVRQTDPNSGSDVQLFRPYPNGTETVSDAAHGHLVTSQTQEGTTTEAVETQLPSYRLAFIVATRVHRCLPRGAIIPLARNKIPVGWRSCHVADPSPDPFRCLTGKFLEGAEQLGLGAAVNGTEEHLHLQCHRHVFQLSGGLGEQKARQGQLSTVATSGHTHALVVENSGETSRKFHLPPYVEMKFAVKPLRKKQ